MNELIKIRDVSIRYAISTRALTYYEDMGLLSSTRSDDYAYRMYDEEAIKRLEQILILRKLNISIKDIQRIFNTPGSEVVLEVLNVKIENIDEEVALLRDLKEVVLEFIRQINQADFSKNSDVKMLYERAKEIETQIANTEYEGSAANVNRLLEVTEKLDDKRITTPVVIRAYKQSLGATRFIGKKFTSGKEAWVEQNKNDLLKVLREHFEQININIKDLYEDGNAFIGLMTQGNEREFEYWLGYFTPENTLVPDGFEHEDFPATNLGVGWIYGHEDEIYAKERMVLPKLKEKDITFFDPPQFGTPWWFERYNGIRSEPDKKGYAIIDICFMGAK